MMKRAIGFWGIVQAVSMVTKRQPGGPDRRLLELLSKAFAVFMHAWR
jgi:hypothetical protein